MDERQAQIQTGAGLTEARLNTEFIDALKKWGPWAVMILAVVILAYVGLGRLRESRERAATEAFAAFNEAERAGNPVNLIRVAEENESRPALAAAARLAAADALMLAAARGVMPGVEVPNDGVVNIADVLSADQKKQLIEQARTQYQTVLASAERDRERWIQAIGAAMGLASAAEAQGQFDAAKTAYQRAKQLAETHDLPAVQKIITDRLASLESLAEITLVESAKVRSRPPDAPTWDPTPIVPGSSEAIGLADQTGQTGFQGLPGMPVMR